MSEKPEPSAVRVKIYDREYAFRTTGDPDRLREVCASLDKRMHEIASSTGAVDTVRVAILAAVGLGDELQRLRNELQQLDDSVARRSASCVSVIERLFGGKQDSGARSQNPASHPAQD